MTTRLSEQQLHAMATARGVDPGFTPKATRCKNNNEESRMQRYLVKWFAANCHRWNLPHIALFSIPNGGNWDARRGSIMKAEGQKKGVPDLFLAHAGRSVDLSKTTHGFPIRFDRTWLGFFLELKTETGRLSPEQIEYHAFLQKQGYKVHVCRSTDAAIAAIEEYLNL